jgi:hypothetical protein
MELRFPGVPAGRPHYESVYCALVHPSEAGRCGSAADRRVLDVPLQPYRD